MASTYRKLTINKVNPRKEFFRVDLSTIVEVVQRHHGTVDYTATPEALEYRNSITMTEEEADFVESVLAGVGAGAGGGEDVE